MLLVLASLLAGCAVGSRSYSTASSGASCLVITRVKLSAQAPDARVPWRSVKTLVRIRDEQNPLVPHKVEVLGEGGLAVLRFAPGDYTVFSVSFSELSIGGNTLNDISYRVYAPFHVPSATAGLYIGDLELSLLLNGAKAESALPAQRASQRTALSALQPGASLPLGVTAEVVDSMDAAVAEFRKEHPTDANILFAKTMMKLQPNR
jgi:hypothetical protein